MLHEYSSTHCTAWNSREKKAQGHGTKQNLCPRLLICYCSDTTNPRASTRLHTSRRSNAKVRTGTEGIEWDALVMAAEISFGPVDTPTADRSRDETRRDGCALSSQFAFGFSKAVRFLAQQSTRRASLRHLTPSLHPLYSLSLDSLLVRRVQQESGRNGLCRAVF